MPTSVTAEISPLIVPASKPTPVRASAAPLVRQWATQNGGSLNGANTLAKDLEGYAHAINGILTTLKTAPTLQSLSSITNTKITISTGNNSITLDPVSGNLILTNGTDTLTLNPSGPSITMVTGSGANELTLTIAGSVLTINGTGTQAGDGNITIDGVLSAASAAVVGAISAASGVITGLLSVGSLTATGALAAASANITGAVAATGFTASGAPGISVAAAVRNSAGSGTSTLTFTDGILTAWTP